MKLLKVEDLCDMLQVKRDWVYDHVRSGDIPYVRVGNLLRFREERIMSWLDEQGK